MFDIGWSEMAIIMLVALVVIGPKDLPRLARTLGQWVAKGRAMAREFQRSLEDMAREAELDDVKREIEKVGRTNIRQSIEKTIDPTGELGQAFNPNSNNKAPTKSLAGSSANGEAKEPAAAKPEPAAEAKPKPEPTPEPEAPSDKASAQPEASAKPATKRKPRSSTKPKTADKPKAKPKSKAASGSAPKPTASESPEAETVAEPG